MAPHIEGPLYYERLGHKGPVMAFVHPNPMDQSCRLYQMARFSTWYRCVAIDIPGYGRSPKAAAGLTVADMAQGCWEAIDDAFGGENGGAGHACYMEQPWLFDRFMIEFLKANGLFAG